jgi:hypothetical protein
LPPLGSAACWLSVWGSKKFPLGSQNWRHVRISGHVPTERKHRDSRRGPGLLLIN